ncbi:GIY-YIG nuclease family protein [Pendulispora albinea]|uniref:GIY-YIG nuclease family protein n=1 Tax=Pendulispora albinea TaxID=2741071 RepID=A0ABZ2LZB0_9BACT
MPLGRSIRIYLDQGEVSGIRYAEVMGRTEQALLCPRHRVSELAERWESVVCRPGAYFLFGADRPSAREVYIGESEDILKRIKRHVIDEDFWHEAVLITNKDGNFTKSHFKYLESRLVGRAKEVNRYSVENDNHPAPAALSRPDVDAVEELFLQVPLLLGVLGHRVLDAIAQVAPAPGYPFEFFCKVKDARATGRVTDEGFVVLKGSTALKGTTETMTPGYIAFKQELIASGKLADRGELLLFREDILFTSPSAAAAVVYGNNANGRVLWKTEDNRTLKQIEERQAR